MIPNPPTNRSTAKATGALEPTVTKTPTATLSDPPIGLQAAGIDTQTLVRRLLAGQPLEVASLFATDPAFALPEAAKRKVEDDDEEDADDDEEETDDETVADDDEVEDDEDDLDDDEDEEDDDEEDDDEEEDDDDLDDPDDDDDFDDDDDEDDFDDDE
jgi:hypothetical protein